MCRTLRFRAVSALWAAQQHGIGSVCHHHGDPLLKKEVLTREGTQRLDGGDEGYAGD